MLPAVAALIADVERVVVAHEEAGWFIDDQEYASIVPTLLESACRVTPPARRAALERLASQADTDPERLYRRQGEMTADVEAALRARRSWEAFRRTLERTDECPFFVLPTEDFQGRQTERNKWIVHLEGGGVAEAVRMAGRLAVGGGGNGRLLLGRGFGDSISVLAGGEIGGGAVLRRPDDSDQFSLKYLAAMPIVLRLHELNWLYDVEIAPLAMLQGDDLGLQWGARLGGLVGLSALRARDFLPWVGVALAVDQYFEGDGLPSAQVLRGGIRVGIRWLP